MKKEWYFRILITAFALLVVMQQQTVVPNQEIVLEFTDIKVTSAEAQNAIAIVKKQLESIGVKNTRISEELHNGTLKISYYSDADVASIKRILAETENVELDHVFYDQNEEDTDKFPLENNEADYSLNVYEIQTGTDINTDFNGIYVLQIKQKQDRASGSYTYGFAEDAHTNHMNRLVKTAQKINRPIAITIGNTSYQIPEVRAGPIS
ncbi:hypothetical protein [uncultured Aquimarina sp.]|uniref:hypothetical protein n=1 Tax=uncultured Aquimarina sp. TaxID=575652 RepID=UPI0026274FF4|nr:hypothetical protein [uncultured Aquimarina sp.]